MKLYRLIGFYLLMVALHVSASGDRDLDMSESSSFYEVSVDALPQQVNYLGSTDQWHFFGRVFTSDDGGMPFSHVDRYRVDAKAVRVNHGWQITSDGQSKYIYVDGCPEVISVESHNNLKILTVEDGFKENCAREK